MKTIFAQGNPGTDYATTRHNIGFMAIDAIAAAYGVSFTAKPRFHAEVADVLVGTEKILLVKPTTFYNETGLAAQQLVRFYQLTPASDLLVIHDDLALPFGTIRVRPDGSDAGNNGIKSLNNHIGAEYWRMRMGIWSEQRARMGDVAFVLGHFTNEEKKIITTSMLSKAKELADSFASGSLTPVSYQTAQ